MNHIIGKVQLAIEEVTEWAFDWGCRFSVEKTQTVFFTRKRIEEGMRLTMYGKVLERVSSFKYLGVIFDSRLTWIDHIKRIEDKCKKVMNVMRCLSGREWGASCASLKTIYVAMVKATIDYGSIVYGSAAAYLLKKVDVLQAQALRICSGAFKSSPVSALQVEMGEMPMEMRRKQLRLNYWANLQGHGVSHPTKEVLQECWEYGKRKRDHFGRVGNEIAKDFGVFGWKISPTVVYPVMPPWRMEWPDGLMDVKREGETWLVLLIIT